jgi:cytochrome c-type biogenesis protein CcmE
VNYEVQAYANAVGIYTFSNLPGGHYTVEARVPTTASAQPIRVGGMVQAAALTRQVKGVEGTVVLQMAAFSQ